MTANLRHFPPQSGDPHGIHIESPDQFLCEALQRQPDVVAAVLRAQSARKRHPPMSADEMLDRLAITVPQFTAAIMSLAHR